MSHADPCRTSAAALLGLSIQGSDGKTFGRVCELAVAPLTDAGRVEALLVRRPGGAKEALVPISGLSRTNGQLRLLASATPATLHKKEEYLLLDRDLLDQQIIDVHGHKVVRVNDVDLFWESDHEQEGSLRLRIAEVEVGVRGAVRRLLKGLPAGVVERLAERVRPSVIPWDFVDLIDRDPSRRVRLKIEQERLSKMHPSDLADILEELAPSEGQALFQSLDEEVAAEALEEVELKTQKQLIESLDSERAAGIMEEMDPGAAADLLSELSEERSDAILEEMGEKERHDVEELLDHDPDSAAGIMTTDYVSVAADASVQDAVDALAAFDGDAETITDVLLVDPERHLQGIVSLSRLMLAERERLLETMFEGHMISCDLETNGRKVAELFDKYNLRCLPILDHDKKLAGVIHAEHVIAFLRTE